LLIFDKKQHFSSFLLTYEKTKSILEGRYCPEQLLGKRQSAASEVLEKTIGMMVIVKVLMTDWE